ncbi:hypothetical protein DEU31_1766 [Brachybacterium sp. AG952]|uniref:hypothetical protein n=1 Tax=Brachybacterium sp. AG952 TaxID=2183989 RepID=UPI00105E1CC9|nr:hypothetical protein [Brachybacterium sp. AG952]TDP78315.1 hypothetical protein DEU31_1766 [Brachybacterium sp. AG952]
MNTDDGQIPNDPHANLKRYAPRSEQLSFEVQAAFSQFLGSVENIGPDVVGAQLQPLLVDLITAHTSAILRAVTDLELDFARHRLGVTDLPDDADPTTP